MLDEIFPSIWCAKERPIWRMCIIPTILTCSTYMWRKFSTLVLVSFDKHIVELNKFQIIKHFQSIQENLAICWTNSTTNQLHNKNQIALSISFAISS